MSNRQLTRRDVLRGSAALGAGLLLPGCGATMGRLVPPDRKLRVAVVGVGGRGWGLFEPLHASEEMVALCDVDRRRAKNALERAPDLPFYADYRVMLAEHGHELDAVVVATPDHMHAPIASAAMRRGLHVYVEKPLTWSIEEARHLADLEREHGVVTQMGNHGSAADGFRAGVERLRAGVLGDVTDIHCWTNRPWWPQAIDPPAPAPVPEGLDWDLWLGCADERPYGEGYLPFSWRGWRDFGTGCFGDMACHTLNLAWRGCELGTPRSVEVETTQRFEESYPAGSHVTLRFASVGGRPPMALHWYDGSKSPPVGVLPDGLVDETPESGLVIHGTEGLMFSPDDYGTEQIWLPEELGTREVPVSLPRVGGDHLGEWVAACKGGPAPYSRFAIAGPFTEMVLLGNLAVHTGAHFTWDAEGLVAEGVGAARKLVRRDYRQGFGLA